MCARKLMALTDSGGKARCSQSEIQVRPCFKCGGVEGGAVKQKEKKVGVRWANTHTHSGSTKSTKETVLLHKDQRELWEGRSVFTNP